MNEIPPINSKIEVTGKNPQGKFTNVISRIFEIWLNGLIDTIQALKTQVNTNTTNIDTNTTAIATKATGAASSIDNTLVRFDGVTGKIIQNGTIIQDDNGQISYNAAPIQDVLNADHYIFSKNNARRYRTDDITDFVNCWHDGTNYFAIDAGACAVYLMQGGAYLMRTYAGASAGQDLGVSINGLGWGTVTPS